MIRRNFLQFVSSLPFLPSLISNTKKEILEVTIYGFDCIGRYMYPRENSEQLIRVMYKDFSIEKYKVEGIRVILFDPSLGINIKDSKKYFKDNNLICESKNSILTIRNLKLIS